MLSYFYLDSLTPTSNFFFSEQSQSTKILTRVFHDNGYNVSASNSHFFSTHFRANRIWFSTGYTIDVENFGSPFPQSINP